MMRNWTARATRIALIGIIALALFGFVVMSLWNWLMPPIFGLRVISFWQALGLVVLSKILFGGFHTHQGRYAAWRHRMRERWGSMTPEEREKFREGVRDFCRPA